MYIYVSVPSRQREVFMTWQHGRPEIFAKAPFPERLLILPSPRSLMFTDFILHLTHIRTSVIEAWDSKRQSHSGRLKDLVLELSNGGPVLRFERGALQMDFSFSVKKIYKDRCWRQVIGRCGLKYCLRTKFGAIFVIISREVSV